MGIPDVYRNKYVCGRDFCSPYDLVTASSGYEDSTLENELTIGRTKVNSRVVSSTIIAAFDEVAQSDIDLRQELCNAILKKLPLLRLGYPDEAYEFSPDRSTVDHYVNPGISRAISYGFIGGGSSA